MPARPKPASTTVSSDHRVSHSSVSVDCSHDESRTSQLLAVLDPRILDDLARQRRDERDDQHRLRDDHRPAA
jgi:hypothetical protein